MVDFLLPLNGVHFDILFFRVSFLIRLAAFPASGGALIKLYETT
jgi:hypothetical protein